VRAPVGREQKACAFERAPGGRVARVDVPRGDAIDSRTQDQPAGQSGDDGERRDYRAAGTASGSPLVRRARHASWPFRAMRRDATDELCATVAYRQGMRILIVGAGVLGSLYGARLSALHDVTLLARGTRADVLRRRGVVLADAIGGTHSVTRLAVVEQLAPEDHYDLVVVLVRKNQQSTVLPIVAANSSPAVLFMVNTASGYDELLTTIGRRRLLVGFAGAGGTMRDDGVVEYTIAPRLLQRTTFGEPDGALTDRLRTAADAFRDAGFPVALERNMDAWQKTHVAWVSPVANAIYAAGGDTRRLARTPEAMRLMLAAIRESFAALDAMYVPITPLKLRPLGKLPERLALPVLARAFSTRRADIILGRHANAARDEMTTLAEELHALIRASGIATPHLDELARFVDPDVPPLPVPRATRRRAGTSMR
jgi:2-dehydropantoate 2-reductase